VRPDQRQNQLIGKVIEIEMKGTTMGDLPVTVSIPNIDISALVADAELVINPLETVLEFAAKWGGMLGLPQTASLAEFATWVGVIKGLLDKAAGL